MGLFCIRMVASELLGAAERGGHIWFQRQRALPLVGVTTETTSYFTLLFAVSHCSASREREIGSEGKFTPSIPPLALGMRWVLV